MDLYAEKARSLPQKVFMAAIELILIGLSFLFLFGGWGRPAANSGEILGRSLILAFNITTFLRFGLTFLFFLERKIPLEEAVSVSFAFATYYVGFSLFAVYGGGVSNTLLVAGLALFVIGSFFNTWSEFQRRRWKALPEHKGHLFTGGLFRLTRHPNYFGDCLWVLGYALVTGNAWALAIPVLLVVFFLFYNIPKLESHLSEHYGAEFEDYRKRTRSLFPFVL